MPLDLSITIPDSWPEGLSGQALANAVEAAVQINFRWYLEMWDVGEDPKCCPACAGVKYLQQMPSLHWRVRTAEVLVQEGYASCESAAAMHTGHMRADGFRNLVAARPLIAALATPEGRAAVEVVKKTYTIMLESTDQLGYWHVVSYDEGKRHDATEEMERA